MYPSSPEAEFVRLMAELSPLIRAYWHWLACAEKVLVELYRTTYAIVAWEKYGGDGLPLGLRGLLLEETDLSAYDHLDLMLTEQFAVADALYWAQEDGDPTATLLIELYQGAIIMVAQNLVLICARLNEVGLLRLFCIPSATGSES
jgi:hypothetical protein